MIGRETLVVLVNMSQLISEKLEEHISNVQVWIKRNIAIVAVIYYSNVIRRDQLTSTLWEWEPDWDPELCLGLVHTRF